MSDRVGIIGLLVGIAGIAVSYYFYRRGKERVEPFFLLQHSPILGKSSSVMRDIRLVYKGREIANLNVSSQGVG